MTPDVAGVGVAGRTGANRRAVGGWPTSFATSAAPAKFGPLLFAGRLEEAARTAAELGHEGIEVSLRSPEELDRDHLGRLLGRHGLRLAAIGSGRAYLEDGLCLAAADAEERRRAVSRIVDLIEYGAELGAPVIVGLLRGKDASPEVWPRLADSMCRCADAAAALGTDVLVEPINRYETPLLCTVHETLAFVNGLQRPNVKLLLDVFHMNIEEVSIGAAIRQAGSLLGHFHVADSNRHAPGFGHVDFDEIIAALNDVDYRGWLSAEVLPLPDDRGAAHQARTFCLRLNASTKSR
jgi:sugar phosphate isomerase/epimerase